MSTPNTDEFGGVRSSAPWKYFEDLKSYINVLGSFCALILFKLPGSREKSHSQGPEQNRMPQMSTGTFHPFPLLPLELRINIWGFATEDRVLKVIKEWPHDQGCWSPTPVPAVTRVCRESRDHCSYHRAFTIDLSPRYIWANFDCDIIQMRAGLLSERYHLEIDEMKHLRIELVDQRVLYELEESLHPIRIRNRREFPKLESFGLLLSLRLRGLNIEFIESIYTGWGASMTGNVRTADVRPEEWINEMCGSYQKYLDSNKATNDEYMRRVAVGGRPVKLVQIPLARINLDS